MPSPKENRSRGWCYTLNNYTQEEFDELTRVECRYHVLGKEVGDKGTPHIQGYIYFKNYVTFFKVKKLLGSRCHIERQKGTTTQASEYCMKEGNFQEIGILPRKNLTKKERAVRNKLLMSAPLNQLVSDGELSLSHVGQIRSARLILAQEAEDYEHSSTRGTWYYGPPGVGKSRRARLENPGAYIKPQSKWWDGYTGQKAVILDDLDGTYLGHYLKIWSDRYACTGEVKGGTVKLQHEKIVVTSNYSPDTLFEANPELVKAIRRRFHVVHMYTPYIFS